MKGRIVDLVEHSRRQGPGSNGHAPNGHAMLDDHGRPLTMPAAPPLPWDTHALSLVTVTGGRVPATAIVRYAVWTDPLAGRWEITITREGWHPVILQGGFRPGQTPEQQARTRAQLDLINEVLAASLGVPA